MMEQAVHDAGHALEYQGLVDAVAAAAGLFLVPFAIDATARYTEYAQRRVAELSAAYGVLVMVILWVLLNRDLHHLGAYFWKGLGIASLTNIAHQKWKPANGWDSESPPDETTAVKLRRRVRKRK